MSTENYLLLILYFAQGFKILSKNSGYFFTDYNFFFQQALKHFLDNIHSIIHLVVMLKAFKE